jgi:protein-tyrosine-phosphatase
MSENIKNINPDSVLFVCNYNSVRSPMAECIAKDIVGSRIFIDSIGIMDSLIKVNPFTVSVMEEDGQDLSNHNPKHFKDLNVSAFDLVICLSIEAEEKIKEHTRGFDTHVTFWPTSDPTATRGSRENIMSAFRMVRDELKEKIKEALDE